MALAKQSDTIINRTVGQGGLIVFQGVRVRAFLGGIEQQLYSDEIGTPVAIVETDVNGLYEFWIAEGEYTLNFSVGGVSLGNGEYSIFNPTPVVISDNQPVTDGTTIWFKTAPGSAIATLWVQDAA